MSILVSVTGIISRHSTALKIKNGSTEPPIEKLITSLILSILLMLLGNVCKDHIIEHDRLNCEHTFSQLIGPIHLVHNLRVKSCD